MFVAMPRVTRPLTVDDFEQAVRLAEEAFGVRPPGMAAPAAGEFPGVGRHHWGTFDGEELVARIVGREYHSWFGGAEVPTNGIAAVTVVAERRGQGLLDDVFRAVLAEGRDRGEVISTLFPTAPGIYRRFGYEVVSLRLGRGADSGLGCGPPGQGDHHSACSSGRFRRRTPCVRRLGSRAERAAHPARSLLPGQRGRLHRRVHGGDSCARRKQRGGRLRAGRGAADTATRQRSRVSDLLATDGRAYPALWRFLGGFGSVTGKVRIETSGRDVARLSLPTVAWQVVGSKLYMLRVDDVPGAFSAIPLPGAAEVAFAVTGDLLESMNGAYRLLVRDGATECERMNPVEVCRPSLRAASPSPTPEPRPAPTSGWPGCSPARPPTTPPSTLSSTAVPSTSATTSEPLAPRTGSCGPARRQLWPRETSALAPRAGIYGPTRPAFSTGRGRG